MNLKDEVLGESIKIISRKLDVIKNECALIQAAANDETKSSMGDKYESGRSVMMQEIEKLASQQGLLLDQLKILKSIDPHRKHTKAQLGSIIVTEEATYFIASAVGLVHAEGSDLFVISARAPIAQIMLNKKKGETCQLNQKFFKILSVL